MTLPQVKKVGLPKGFHRGATIGSIGGIVAAAGTKVITDIYPNGVKYDTKTKRAIRLEMASLMIRPVTSFNQLVDHEIQGMLVACTADVAGIAQWLAGQDYPGTRIESDYSDEMSAYEYETYGYGPEGDW